MSKQTNKESGCRTWCETCQNPAWKCKNKCTGPNKENDFNKTYNPKK